MIPAALFPRPLRPAQGSRQDQGHAGEEAGVAEQREEEAGAEDAHHHRQLQAEGGQQDQQGGDKEGHGSAVQPAPAGLAGAALEGGDLFALQMRAGDGSVRFDLFGVQSFSLDRMTCAPEGFASFLSANNVGVIPLPAPLWLLPGGLGTLAAVGRRRAA